MNPYSHLSTLFNGSLDYIIQNITQNPPPQFDDLNNQLVNSIIGGGLMPTPGIDTFLALYMKTLLPHVYNGYTNVIKFGGYATPTEKQAKVIAFMLEGINKVPVESIDDFLGTVDDHITTAGMTYEEQIPLFLAVAAAHFTYQYFMNQIPQPSSWGVFLNPNSSLNFANLPGWTSAAFEGTLLAFTVVTPNVQLLDMMTGMMGAIGLASGKVIFKWLPG